LVGLALLLSCAAPADQGRLTIDFDTGWKFHLGDVTGGQEPGRNDAGWRTLDVPHDRSIEGAFAEEHPAGAGGGALPGGIGTIAASDNGDQISH
jgi:beta-galactosidase